MSGSGGGSCAPRFSQSKNANEIEGHSIHVYSLFSMPIQYAVIVHRLIYYNIAYRYN